MFNTSPWDLFLLAVIAVLAVGPQRLPELANSLGKAVRRFRKTLEENRQGIQSAVSGVRDVAGDEGMAVLKELQELREMVSRKGLTDIADLKASLKAEVMAELEAAKEAAKEVTAPLTAKTTTLPAAETTSLPSTEEITGPVAVATEEPITQEQTPEAASEAARETR
jgi:TatA/E family protein of Tat protein translocase